MKDIEKIWVVELKTVPKHIKELAEKWNLKVVIDKKVSVE